MNWKTTLVLLVVVLLLFGWVYFNEPKIEPTKLGDTHVFRPQVHGEDVTRLVIDRGDGLKEQLVFVKEERVGWKLEKPVADRADDGNVRDILNKLEFLEHKQGGRLEGDKASQFGTVVSKLTVSRPADKGGDVALEFGNKVADAQFVRVVGKPGAFIVGKELGEFVAFDLFKFRTKELFTTVGVDAGKVSLTFPSAAGPGTPPELHELVRGKDRFWRIKGEGGELAETKKVVDLITKVQQIKPSGIAQDNPSESDLAKFGLDKPAFTIVLNAFEAPPADPGAPKDAPKPQPKSDTLKLGSEVEAGKDARYALFDDRKVVYKVDASEALRELRKDEGLLRSDMLFPLHGGAEGVTGLDAKFLGGKEVKLAKKDDDWTLVLPGAAKAEKESARTLVRLVAELKIADREPGDAALHFDKYGLTEPVVAVALEEAGEPRTIQLGSEVPGKAGFRYARRADEARVFTTKTGDLVEKLKGASLAVRTKSLLKGNKWEAISVALTSPEGKTLFEAKKDKNNWSIPGVDEKDLDEPKLQKVLDGFDDVKASDLVAEVTSADPVLATYGLDKPSKLTVTTEKWDADKGAKARSDTTLLLGKRDGDRIFAMETNGTAVGRVDAEFLDRIARGFRKGKEIFQVSSYDAVSIDVVEGDKAVLSLVKDKVGLDDEWFLKAADGSKTLLVRSEVRDRLLEAFEKIEATRTEGATDASKKEHGLAPAWRKITIHTKQAFGDKKEETKVLLLGQRVGEHDVYAMDESGQDLGVIYDAPVFKVDQFVASPPKAPAPSPSPAEAPPVGPGAPPQAPGPQAPAPQAPGPQAPAPQVPGPQAPAPQATSPAVPAESPKPEAPKADAPKADGPKADAPKAPAASPSVPPELAPPSIPGASPAPAPQPSPAGAGGQ